MAGWTHERRLLAQEITQRRDEGCVVPQAIEDAVEALRADDAAWDEVQSAPIWHALEKLPVDPALALAEPDELEVVRMLRSDGPRDLHWQPDEADLIDRLHGAWTGRAVGCALGKPVESGDYGRATESGQWAGRNLIRQLLDARGD